MFLVRLHLAAGHAAAACGTTSFMALGWKILIPVSLIWGADRRGDSALFRDQGLPATGRRLLVGASIVVNRRCCWLCCEKTVRRQAEAARSSSGKEPVEAAARRVGIPPPPPMAPASPLVPAGPRRLPMAKIPQFPRPGSA